MAIGFQPGCGAILGTDYHRFFTASVVGFLPGSQTNATQMTCIIGIVDGKRTIIGGDSAGVGGYDITIRRDAKVFRSGDFVIGGAGSFRAIQLIRYQFRAPAIETDDLYEYMCTSFVENVRHVLTQGGLSKVDNNVNTSEGLLLVGYANRLFSIQSDFQVGENIDGVDAIGCGESYAFGAIAAMPKSMNGKSKVRRALEIAVQYSAGVRPPFIIEST